MSRKPLLFASLTIALVAQAAAAPHGDAAGRFSATPHGKARPGALADKPVGPSTPQEERRDGWSGFYFGANAGSGRAAP